MTFDISSRLQWIQDPIAGLIGTSVNRACLGYTCLCHGEGTLLICSTLKSRAVALVERPDRP